MIDRLLSLIAPHYCCGCGEVGVKLCDCCKNDILEDTPSICIFCRKLVKNANLCSNHQLPYSAGYLVGFRDGPLLKLIDDYKFNRAKESAKVIAELIISRLPAIYGDIVIVPIPTTPHNVRVRGYDHMLLIARYLSRQSGWSVEPVLTRQNNITQHYAKSAAQRKEQAKSFFRVKRELSTDKIYLLIDDILTTGSTVQAAARCLREAGADNVIVAVAAIQR